MRTSDKGIAQLNAEEGVVLKAYRCPAGVWTIGPGLTAASGVVKPKAGMVITRQESDRLTTAALERNYEPRVNKALGHVLQHVFDGSVLFDWNTGAIQRASWVPAFLDGKFDEARGKFDLWVKAGGKTLTGLIKRRGREWNLIRNGVYTLGRHAVSAPSDYVADLHHLGYRQNRLDDAVRAFQRDHGLAVDGIVGPATRAALIRAKADLAATKAAGAGGAGGAVAGGGAEVVVTSPADPAAGLDLVTALWALGGLIAVVGLILGAHYVWSHRGPLFAGLPAPVKDWFEARGIVLGRRVRT